MAPPKPIADIIDLEHYPLHNLSSPSGRRVIAACQQQLRECGLCLLENFIQLKALQRIQQNAHSLLADAHYTEHWRATPNGNPDEQSPVQHSKLATATRASMSSIAYDQLDADSALRRLYTWDAFSGFINLLFDGPELFATADPLVGCMLTVMKDGDELGWHYDPNDIVISLSIEEPAAGGEFEFAPRIRQPAANALENETAVLAGSYAGTMRKCLAPGTLSLFNGRQSLHRVAPVSGPGQRIIALFNYSEVPYYSFDDNIHRRFFGRTGLAN